MEHVGFRVCEAHAGSLAHQLRCASEAERDEWLSEVLAAASAVPAVAETRRLTDVATEETSANAGAELEAGAKQLLGQEPEAETQAKQGQGQGRRGKARPRQQRQPQR